MGSTPAAPGSSVPVWPTRFILNICLTSATASLDVIPGGFNMFTIPSVICVSVYGYNACISASVSSAASASNSPRTVQPAASLCPPPP